jgi:hypothetical protein
MLASILKLRNIGPLREHWERNLQQIIFLYQIEKFFFLIPQFIRY